MRVRRSAVAGAFYPEGEALGRMVDGFLKKVPEVSVDGELKALIVPHAGYIYSGQVAAYAYALLKGCRKKKFVILGPSHYVYFNDVVSDSNEFWETPLGRVGVAESGFPKLGEAHAGEHSVEVQLPFLQRVAGDFEILPLVAGDADPEEISEKILGILDDDSMLIISSDLSHYHDYSTAVRLDRKAIGCIEKIDYSAFAGEEACGKIPVMAVLHIAKRLGWKCKLLNYANSGDVSGDRESVVGYASFAFYKNDY